MKAFPPVLACSLAAAITLGCATPGADGSGAGGDMGTGGSAQTCMPGDPTPAGGGAAFPFPQHRLSQYCYYPTGCNDADVSNAWNMYKATFIVPSGNGLRVQRPESGGDTVSEGLGYAMIAAVYMNDKPTFDGLWAFTNQRLDANGLMYWHQTPAGARATDAGGGATDADEDIAFALVMADKQWGGYTTPAKAMVAAILAHEVESGSNVLKPGDNFGGSSQLDPSYIAPAYYRVFAAYSGNNQWMSVLTANNSVLMRCANPSTGLVPDWCNASGQAQPPPSGGATTAYGYDAARTPFRVTLDACWSNDPTSMALAGKFAAFFDGVGLTSVRDGYTLSGTLTGSSAVLVFQGPAAVSGMAANKTQLVNDGYTRISRVVANGGLSGNYFSASWALLSAMIMTGNFVNFVAP